jgi:hypothetical protein
MRRIEPLTEYIVEAKSREDLRCLANMLRNQLGLENTLWMPIVEILEILPEIFDDFSYEIVSDDELPVSIHAETDVRTGHIRIKESIYERACDGERRDRMTIAHEIGHYFTLCYCGFKLQRSFGKGNVPRYQDPEWQAKCFAGEFMVAKHLTQGMTPDEIAKSCGVSFEAADVQSRCR